MMSRYLLESKQRKVNMSGFCNTLVFILQQIE